MNRITNPRLRSKLSAEYKTSYLSYRTSRLRLGLPRGNAATIGGGTNLPPALGVAPEQAGSPVKQETSAGGFDAFGGAAWARMPTYSIGPGGH